MKIFSLATLVRVIKNYLKEDDMCQSCGGSRKCCGVEKDKNA